MLRYKLAIYIFLNIFMPIFIVCCLLLTTLVQTASAYLPFLNIEMVWQAGALMAGLFLLIGCLKKLPSSIWHDGFACCLLWAWYGYWEPQFSKGSPMFHIFPIYYAILCLWMWLGVIQKSAQLDADSREALRYLQKYLSRFDSCMVASGVLITLAFPEHYLLYPITMTLFIVRSTMQRCLEIIDSQP